MTKKYSSTKTHHILTNGLHRVAIERVGGKKITKKDKEKLDEYMESVVEFRNDPARDKHYDGEG